MSSDADLVRGWTAASKGEPYDEHESEQWKEGFRLREAQRKFLEPDSPPRFVSVAYTQ